LTREESSAAADRAHGRPNRADSGLDFAHYLELASRFALAAAVQDELDRRSAGCAAPRE
jgi:hypothetical protein